MCHLVVGSPQLETENRLQVFPFQENIAFQSVAKIDCMSQWCFLDHVIHPRSENETEILMKCQEQVFTQSPQNLSLTSG